MLAGHIKQQSVVIGSMRNDEMAKVENRQIQQTFLNQVQGIEYPAGTAIAVVNG